MTTPTIAAPLARAGTPVHKARRQRTGLEDPFARPTEPSAPGSVEDVLVMSGDAAMTTPAIAAALARASAPVHEARRQRTGLEDPFARLTQPSAPGSVEDVLAMIGDVR